MSRLCTRYNLYLVSRSYGLTASQVVRLIVLLLVFASHNVKNEMAESIVPLRKSIKDSLTRQGMWNIRGLHRKGLAGREEKVMLCQITVLGELLSQIRKPQV